MTWPEYLRGGNIRGIVWGIFREYLGELKGVLTTTQKLLSQRRGRSFLVPLLSDFCFANYKSSRWQKNLLVFVVWSESVWGDYHSSFRNRYCVENIHFYFKRLMKHLWFCFKVWLDTKSNTMRVSCPEGFWRPSWQLLANLFGLSSRYSLFSLYWWICS